MCSHVGTFQHLGEPLKGADEALDKLKGSLRALTEAVRQAIGIIWIHAHPARRTYSAIHPTHATYASIHGAISPAVHRTAHAAEPRIGRRVVAIATNPPVWGGTKPRPTAKRRVIRCRSIHHRVQRGRSRGERGTLRGCYGVCCRGGGGCC